MMDQQETFTAADVAHQSDGTSKIRTVKKTHLINKLNYINFLDGTIRIVFEHRKYPHTRSLFAKPHPCLGDELECTWPETEIDAYRHLGAYRFKEIHIPDGKNVIVVRPEDIFINGKTANFLLPETGYELRARQRRRYDGKDVHVQMMQNGVSFEGKLVDFNGLFYHVEIIEDKHHPLSWINRASNLNLILSNKAEILFSGECKAAQIRNGLKHKKNFILEPVNYAVSRYQAKEFRATRFNLVPSPYVVCLHPFTDDLATLSVLDISGSGVSVKEDGASGQFIPGMILPRLEIHLGNSFHLTCKAQVMHCTAVREEDGPHVGGSIKTGLAFLEMDIQEHGKLLALLHQAKDPNSYLDGKVNEEDLWQFFFDSGFIYPKKYKFIQENKESIKSTYRKIYTQSPNIAKRFIYRDRGEILGHLAMVRFYQKSWMIQHHASHPVNAKLAGIDVLDQVGRFINESNSLFSIHMDYVFCYFREDNKFPNHVFGGAAKNIGDLRKCSLDAFSYFHYKKHAVPPRADIKPPWHLIPSISEDLVELQLFYKEMSGGILLDALELLPGYEDIGDLVAEYGQSGFNRGRNIFTLSRENRVKAVFVLNFSDIGLNLSDITNSIHVFVVDAKDFNAEILEHALLMLAAFFTGSDIPVLLYPRSVGDQLHVVGEKIYNLWALDVAYSDNYFDYMHKFFKRLNSIKPFADH